MKTQRLYLYGSIIGRNNDPGNYATQDQFFTNYYPEVITNAVNGKSRVYTSKRPGFSSSSALTGVLNGSFAACVFSGSSTSPSPVVFAAGMVGQMSTSVWTSQSVQVGNTITSTQQCVSLTETVINDQGHLVGIFRSSATNSTEAWYYPEGDNWTKIVHTSFPADIIGPPAHMDGYSFYMTKRGVIWNTTQNTVSTTIPTAFVTAQSMPDGGCGLARYKNLIVAFGKGSIEFFQNAGLNPAPLIPIGNAVNRIGAVPPENNAPTTIYPVANTVYWIGVNSETGQKGFYRLNGYSAEKVSNSTIDKLINSNVITGIAGAFTANGMSHVMTYTSSGVPNKYCFCVDTNTWWIFTASAFETPTAIIGSSGNSYMVTLDNAKIYSMFSSSVVYQDGGITHIGVLQTAPIDHGTMNKKFFHRFKVVGDLQNSTSVLSVSYSDDDYRTSSIPRTIESNSIIEMTNGLTRLGSSRRRAWKMTHNSAAPSRIEAIELDYEVGPT